MSKFFRKDTLENIKVYNYIEALVASGYPMSLETGERDVTERDVKRMKALASAKTGSGHDCALKGILVTFDLTLSQAGWQQFQRYHFADIVSSQSKMHRITHLDVNQQCCKWVDPRVIDICNELKETYFTLKDGNASNVEVKEAWKRLVYTVPTGFMLTASVTTNYLQLKTICEQRKNHKLDDEWGSFVEAVKEMPFSDLIF